MLGFRRVLWGAESTRLVGPTLLHAPAEDCGEKDT